MFIAKRKTNLIEEDEIYDEGDMTCCERVKDYMSNCSLFILHRDTKLRSWCLALTETRENIAKMRYLVKHNKIDEYKPDEPFQMPQEKGDKTVDELQKAAKLDEEFGPAKKFDNIILVLIILSSITLVIDNPLQNPQGQFKKVLSVIDIVFTVLFFIEAAIKILAHGFLFNRLGPVTPYITSVWNQLDFFVVAASLIDLTFMIFGIDSSQISALKALRVLRALRPLRMISKDPGMKLVVNALLASIPSMSNVLLVCALIILIFSIMGVNFFKGKFHYCAEESLPPDFDYNLINDKTDCLEQGGEWVSSDQNFDNTLVSMFTLFQMMTTEGWLDVFYSSLDARGIDM